MNWRALRPRSLYARTVVTLAVALLVFQVIAGSVLAYYMLVPMARRSADDMAALMVLSAQTWLELPPQTRPDFEHELALNHGLVIAPPTDNLDKKTYYLPYIALLARDLSRRTGQPGITITTRLQTDGKRWFWTDLPMGSRILRIGFDETRVDIHPPLALTLVLALATLLTLITASILVRRLTRPLTRLAAAAEAVGRGQAPAALPENGPLELAQLARRFNHMAGQVQALLTNRTTLLSGISHDLRTPLARMRLALEMLPEQADPALVTGLKHDLDDMNRLIGQFLELGRGLNDAAPQRIDLTGLLTKLADNVRRAGHDVHWQAGDPLSCLLRALPLERILTNLLDNAVRYGQGKTIELTADKTRDGLCVCVCDRGPGIPADQQAAVFRPFYRLEGSRSSDSGGSGLGLAIASQLAEANGWPLTLHDREGGGTRACLLLPHPEAQPR